MASLQDKFEKFDAENPHVYQLYRKFAAEAVDSGMKKLSISLVTERVRWEAKIVTRSDDNFKINNNHRAFYARKLNQEPLFKDKFIIREQSVHSF